MQRIDRTDKYIRDKLSLKDSYVGSPPGYDTTSFSFPQNAAAIRDRDIERIKYLAKQQTIVSNFDSTNNWSLLDVAANEANEVGKEQSLIEIVALMLNQHHSEKLLRSDSSALNMLIIRGHFSLLRMVINHYNRSHFDLLKPLLPGALIIASQLLFTRSEEKIGVLSFLFNLDPSAYDKKTLNRAFLYSLLNQDEQTVIAYFVGIGAEISVDLVNTLFQEALSNNQKAIKIKTINEWPADTLFKQRYSDLLFWLLFRGIGRTSQEAISMADLCLPLIPYARFQRVMEGLGVYQIVIKTWQLEVLKNNLEVIPLGLQKFKLQSGGEHHSVTKLLFLLKERSNTLNLQILDLTTHRELIISDKKFVCDFIQDCPPLDGKNVWRLFFKQEPGVKKLIFVLQNHPHIKPVSLNNAGHDEPDASALQPISIRALNLSALLPILYGLYTSISAKPLNIQNVAFYGDVTIKKFLARISQNKNITTLNVCYTKLSIAVRSSLARDCLIYFKKNPLHPQNKEIIFLLGKLYNQVSEPLKKAIYRTLWFGVLPEEVINASDSDCIEIINTLAILEAALSEEKESDDAVDLLGSLENNPPMVKFVDELPSAIKSLHLDYRELKDKQVKSFLDLLKKNQKLRGLNLSQNLLAGSRDLVTTLVQQFPNLESLDLSYNSLGGRYIWTRSWSESGVEILANVLYGHSRLRKLGLKDVGLDDRDAHALRVTLDSLQGFTELDFTPEELEADEEVKLNVSLGQARARAELLGYPLPSGIRNSWRRKIKQIKAHYVASDVPSGEVRNEFNSEQLYNFTCSLISLFVPKDARLQFLQNKEEKKQQQEKEKGKEQEYLLNYFEGLQWRALDAEAKLKKLDPTLNDGLQQEAKLLEEIINIWVEFIIGGKTEAGIRPSCNVADEDSDSFPIIAQAFKDWLEICKLVQRENENRLKSLSLSASSLPSFDEWPKELNFIQARWFYNYFWWTLDSLWHVSNVTRSGHINISKPLLKHEQFKQHLKEIGIHALLAMPVIGELGHAIFHGIKAGYTAGASSASLAQELVHVSKFSDSLIEGMEDIPAMQHYLHQIGHLPRAFVERITQKKWLNTEELLENLFKSFTNASDYHVKIEGLLNKFIHHFDNQLRNLSSDGLGAGQLGRACAQHLMQALMLGLLKNHLPLSIEQFIRVAFRWLTCIPMQSPPWLRLDAGNRMSADTLLRRTGLKGYVNNQPVYFHGSLEVETLDGYNQHHDKINCVYQADRERVGYRWADEIEVGELNRQLKLDGMPANIVLGQETGNQIARLSWNTDVQVLAALRAQRVSSVTANATFWKPDRVRMALQEEQVAELKKKQGEQAKVIAAQGEMIKAQGKIISQLKRRLDKLEGIPDNTAEATSSTQTDNGAATTSGETATSISQNASTFFENRNNKVASTPSAGVPVSSSEAAVSAVAQHP